MLLADVLLTLVHNAVNLGEDTKLTLDAAIREHFKSDLDGQSDDEKANARAPIARTSAGPAQVLVSTESFNAAVAKAVAELTSKAQADAAKADANKAKTPVKSTA